jgi:hypothetical protein
MQNNPKPALIIKPESKSKPEFFYLKKKKKIIYLKLLKLIFIYFWSWGGKNQTQNWILDSIYV